MAEATEHGRLAELVNGQNDRSTIDERANALHELIALYDEEKMTEAEAEETRQAFLLLLKQSPEILQREEFAEFLIEWVKPEDFTSVRWAAADDVASFCASLSSFRYPSETAAERVRAHTNHLLREALHQFEQQGESEKLFHLLQITPNTTLAADPELVRLRSRAYVYEMRRVRRLRRLLYGYLIIQALLIIIVFPVLFINAENGFIQKQIEEAAKVDLPYEGSRPYAYSEALYWSLITAGSIGYGDVTPNTTIGRIIAAVLGIMGVISVGVIAGLILNWITPRPLD